MLCRRYAAWKSFLPGSAPCVVPVERIGPSPGTKVDLGRSTAVDKIPSSWIKSELGRSVAVDDSVVSCSWTILTLSNFTASSKELAILSLSESRATPRYPCLCVWVRYRRRRNRRTAFFVFAVIISRTEDAGPASAADQGALGGEGGDSSSLLGKNHRWNHFAIVVAGATSAAHHA
jgi:hypothetical protein